MSRSVAGGLEGKGTARTMNLPLPPHHHSQSRYLSLVINRLSIYITTQLVYCGRLIRDPVPNYIDIHYTVRLLIHVQLGPKIRTVQSGS